MIDFSHIDKFSRKYDIYNRYLKFCHNHIYYKQYRIVGKENIPPKGVPTLVIANHQNGLTDALVLLYMFDDNRQPVFIARGDIFKNSIVARILYFLKILPTFRNRDGNRSDVRANNETFHIAAEVLNRKNTLVMFPEAAHQHGHYLGTFKKGFPRIAFTAEEYADYSLNLQILPVNIHYSDYYNFRSRVVITVDRPFGIRDFFDTYKKEPNQAYLDLNDYAREKVKAITIDEDPAFYVEYDQIRNMLHTQRLKEKGLNTHDLYLEKLEDMEIVAEIDRLKEEDRSRFKELMSEVDTYTAGLRKLGLRDWLINKPVSLLSLTVKTFLYLLGLPLFLFGWIHNILPFSFPRLLKRKIKDRQLHSSMNFAPGVVLTFPLMYLIWFILAWIISGKFWFALLYGLAAFASLFFFYAYRKGALKLSGAWRYFVLKKKKNPLLLSISAIKNKMMTNGIR